MRTHEVRLLKASPVRESLDSGIHQFSYTSLNVRSGSQPKVRNGHKNVGFRG